MSSVMEERMRAVEKALTLGYASCGVRGAADPERDRGPWPWTVTVRRDRDRTTRRSRPRRTPTATAPGPPRATFIPFRSGPPRHGSSRGAGAPATEGDRRVARLRLQGEQP